MDSKEERTGDLMTEAEDSAYLLKNALDLKEQYKGNLPEDVLNAIAREAFEKAYKNSEGVPPADDVSDFLPKGNASEGFEKVRGDVLNAIAREAFGKAYKNSEGCLPAKDVSEVNAGKGFNKVREDMINAIAREAFGKAYKNSEGGLPLQDVSEVLPDDNADTLNANNAFWKAYINFEGAHFNPLQEDED